MPLQRFLQGSANHFFKLLVTTGHRGAGTRSVQGATDFLREIALEDITFFDVVVTINQHATFIARGNFFGIFLEPFQLVQTTVLLDDDVVPSHPDLRFRRILPLVT